MKENTRKKAPNLRLVSGGCGQRAPECDVELTVRMERLLRQDLKHVAHARGTTIRKLITRAVRRIIAEFKDSRETGIAIERDD